MSKRLLAAAVMGILLLTACGGNGASEHAPDNPATEAELRDLLLAELTARGIDPAKAPSKAPSGGPSNTLLYQLYMGAGEPSIAAPQTISFRMFTMIAGDCDGNAEVNIGDISRLAAWMNLGYLEAFYGDPAANYGQEFYPNSPNCHSDGDRNRVISVADVTPIGVHYGERLDGWHVYVKSPGEAAFSPLEDPEQPGAPRFFKASDFEPNYIAWGSCSFEVTQEGTTQFYVVPVDNRTGDEGSPSQTFDFVSNHLPTASFTVSNPNPDTAQIVELDASASADPDADVLNYYLTVQRVDPPDNSVGAEVIEGSIDSPIAKFRFALLGTYTVKLTVFDSRGAGVEAAEQTIVVDTVGGAQNPAWEWHEVPPGIYPANPQYVYGSLKFDLQEIAGRAALINAGESAIKYMSAPPDGSAWTPAVIALASDYALLNPTLAEVGGRPAVMGVYISGLGHLIGGGEVRYNRALDAEGTTWPDYTAADGSGSHFAGGIVERAGQPYLLASKFADFRILQGSDLDGTSFTDFAAPVFPADTIDGHRFTLLSSGSDYYVVNTEDAAEVFHSSDLATWTRTATLVPQVTYSNAEAHPQIVNGRLALAWSSGAGIQYSMALDAAATQWIPVKHVTQPLSPEDEGYYAQAHNIGLAAIEGVPVIAYATQHGELKLIRATNSNGTNWDRAGAETLSNYGTPRDCDLALIAGQPAVVVFNYTTQKLEYGRRL